MWPLRGYRRSLQEKGVAAACTTSCRLIGSPEYPDLTGRTIANRLLALLSGSQSARAVADDRAAVDVGDVRKPQYVDTYVKSLTQSWFGRSARNWRRRRCSGHGAFGWLTFVRNALPRPAVAHSRCNCRQTFRTPQTRKFPVQTLSIFGCKLFNLLRHF